MLRRTFFCVALVVAAFLIAAPARAQRPAPFPRPGEAGRPSPPAPAPAQPQSPPTQPAPAPAPQVLGEPNEATLGMPVYPAAQFITSYDAGRGQRYYLFGTNAGFADIVQFYRTRLKQRGELVYEEPPVHMFDVGRFREETMAFPPGITVKDYTWGGSAGYLNPKRGAEPERFRTIIQIVPPPPGAPR